MPEAKEETKMGTVTAGAIGVAGGGGLASVIVGLIMSNMSTGIKSVQSEMSAATKELRAENKIGLEQIKHLNFRMNNYETVSTRKSDRIEEKIDKTLEIIRLGTKDRFTNEDQEKYALRRDNQLESRARKYDAKFDRLEGKIDTLAEKIEGMKQETKKP